MTEGGRRIAIGIDESDFAEQAFNCKSFGFLAAYHVSFENVVDRNRKSYGPFKLLKCGGRMLRCYKKYSRIESLMCVI